MKGGVVRGGLRRKGEDRGSKRKQTAIRRERAGKRKKKRHRERKREGIIPRLNIGKNQYYLFPRCTAIAANNARKEYELS